MLDSGSSPEWKRCGNRAEICYIFHMKATKNKKNEWNFGLLLGEKGETGLPALREKAVAETGKFVKKWKDRTDWLEDPAVLREALDEYENWARFYGPNATEEYYYKLHLEQDQNDIAVKARHGQTMEVSQHALNEIHFFTLRLGKASADNQKKFLNDPLLAKYHHFLEQLFKSAKHTLSEAEEKILVLKSEPSHEHWVRMTESFLADEEREIKIGGKKQKFNYPQLISLLAFENKKVRDEAAKAFNDIIKKHANTAEAEINAILNDKKSDDLLRGYERPDADRHLSDDINSEVVDTMLEAVSSRFDLSARFYKLKAKLLGQPKLAYHERNVPIGRIDKKLSYDESVNLVQKVFTGLDPEFRAIFDRFQEAGQFDVFPQKGKSGGAFCASGLLSHPTYIMLNYTDRLNDALTIAHEVGHGINNELQRKTQSALNFGTPLATAEVASTFMEDFVLEEILKKETSDKFKLSLAMMKLGSDINSIFRQVACYRFEQELHTAFRAKSYLPKSEIGKIFQKHMKSYMGSAVEQSAGSENWWVYWSHIRNFFYVYSYASGLLISKAMQEKVKDDRAFITKVKEFLSAGSSASPKDIFAKMGIDITNKKFWETGLAQIEAELKQAEQLAKKLNYKV